MNKTEQSQSGKFTLLSNNNGVYQLSMKDENGRFWLEAEEIKELISFLTKSLENE